MKLKLSLLVVLEAILLCGCSEPSTLNNKNVKSSLHQFFNQSDANRDGKIDREEFLEQIRRARVNVNENRVNKLFDLYDENHDDILSSKEVYRIT